MDVFNQTVAVKDIESLNAFIRRHMLEKRNWKEEINRILAHFDQLSEAHRVLVQAREQLELLRPVKRAAEKYEAASDELKRLLALKGALRPWFCTTKVERIEPLIAENEQRLNSETERKAELERTIAEREESIRQLKGEIDRAGGPRLQVLPGLIREAETRAAQKRLRFEEFSRFAGDSGIETESSPRDETAFGVIRESLAARREELCERIPAHEAKKADLGIQRHEMAREIEELESEIAALRERRTAVPERLVQLRRRLCESLHLKAPQLPFAAELVAVKSEERDWESSIEMVLHSFALSLLVSEKFYTQVSTFIDRERLTDARGRGQRLVYFRVGGNLFTPSAGHDDSPTPSADTLPGKLDYRPDHRLVPWVKGEIARRFNFACCDTVEGFQRHRGDAMTMNRHVKSGRGSRHEKDDRRRTTDRGHYVLGWDNREKLKFLIERARQFSEQRARVDDEIWALDSALNRLRDQQRAAERALETTEFSSIDYRTEEGEIAELRQEEENLRSGTEQLRDLDRRLRKAERDKADSQKTHENVIESIAHLTRDLESARQALAEAREELEGWMAADTLSDHKEWFSQIETLVSDSGHSLDNPLALDLPERNLSVRIDNQVDAARRNVEPLVGRLRDAMTKFLRKFDFHGADLSPSEDYAGSFVELHDRIEREDLPGFEQRFKDRLNDKAAKEIAVLNGKLQAEEREIKSNIDRLNDALRSIDYHPGSHMQLLPQPVRDPEILRFKGQLRDCLADAFESSTDADEKRFKRIERLISDLRDEPRYRDRVTDVRRWFDFFACEIVTDTGEERSRYSDSSGRSGGEKAKLAFTILVAAIAYQYQIDPRDSISDRFHFVVVDEMFAKMADDYSLYALELFEKLGLQLLIVAPLDAKARITEDYVDYYLLVTKDEDSHRSEIFSMSAERFRNLSQATDAA